MPAVSVCVLTYNHEKYIATALDSILAQKTNFPFEIIVHDDCSTDRTQEIVMAYKEKYPEIIVPIFQTENQFSKGENFFDEAAYSKARGRYVAVNEGDDFWLDENKLQAQFDFMEENPDYSLCCHAARQADDEDRLLDYRYPDDVSADAPSAEIPMARIIAGGSKVPTNSYFFRSEIAKTRFPEFYRKTQAGDYAMILYFALRGKVFFINQIFSAYRYNSVGSWSRGTILDPTKYIRSNNTVITLLEGFNEFSQEAYQDLVKQKIIEVEFDTLLRQFDTKKLREQPYRTLYKALPLSTRIKFRLKTMFPALYQRYYSRKTG